MRKSSSAAPKQPSSKRSSNKKACILSRREVYRGPAFSVTTDHVLEPSGIRARRDIVHHTGSIVVLAIDESRKGKEPQILFERQYRHAAGRYLWELPAGRIDKGEKELAAAKRELLEETGYSAARWRRIIRFWASPGFVAEAMSIYLAQNLRAGKAQPEADEAIQVSFIPLSKAVGMVMNQAIRDAKTISGVLWLAQTHNSHKGKK
jgi:ADP-ribose diphosphatase